MAQVPEVLVARRPEIERWAGPSEAREVTRRALISHALGNAISPAPWQLDVGDAGEVHVKGAYEQHQRYFAVKISTGFYGNAKLGLPSSSGMVAVFDAYTGLPVTLLLDDGYLTELRTAAAGALAADALSIENVETAAIIGTGGQARYQIQALLLCRRPRRLLVVGRDPGRLTDFVDWAAAQHSWKVESAETASAAVASSQLVITVTPATRPIVPAEAVQPGTHITAVGSDTPGKRELPLDVIRQADLIAVDDESQSRSLGELQGVEGDLPVVSLGAVLNGSAPGRRSDEDVTIADLTGLGVQDAALAEFVTVRALHDSAAISPHCTR